MKKIIFVFLLAGCSSTNTDWDSGASKREMHQEKQRQEQVDNTNMQLTSPGRSGASQSLPQ